LNRETLAIGKYAVRTPRRYMRVYRGHGRSWK